MDAPLVSVITPTTGRQHLLPALYDVFLTQTYSNLELLIHEDGPARSTYLDSIQDQRVRYIYSEKKITTGAKRNRLIQEARGEIIVFFDDDDYYSPEYITAMIGFLEDADMVKLSGWFAYSVLHDNFFYWDTTDANEIHFKVGKGPIGTQNAKKAGATIINMFMDGYGFSYVFRKKAFSSIAFPDIDFGEDIAFVTAAKEQHKRIKYINDQTGLSIHMLHANNLSLTYPQYRLPGFVISRIFPGYPSYSWMIGRTQRPTISTS